jgi:hypothetical protein
LLEILANILFVAAWIYALYLCFTWDQNFPKVFIILLAATLAMQIVDSIVAVGFFGYEMTREDGRDFGRAIIGCLIWIPYMMKSKRVRNTFRPVP